MLNPKPLFVPPNTPVVGVVTIGEPPLGVAVAGIPDAGVDGVFVGMTLFHIKQYK